MQSSLNGGSERYPDSVGATVGSGGQLAGIDTHKYRIADGREYAAGVHLADHLGFAPDIALTRARKVSVTPIGVGLMNLIPRLPVTQSIRGRLPGSRSSAR